MLELKNITKIYNPGEITEACLFRDFNLSVEAGEFVSIVGSNGSGKTSLLNIICGSIPLWPGVPEPRPGYQSQPDHVRESLAGG